MLDRNDLMQCAPTETRFPSQALIHDAGLDVTLANQLLDRIRSEASATTSEGFSANARALAEGFDEVAQLREAVIRALRRAEHFCILRGIDVTGLSLDDTKLLMTTLMATVCDVSDNTAYATHSGSFADEVRPSDKPTTDPTYQFDTEVHADESSKLHPEDLVALFAVRPASDGGDSLLWPMQDVVAEIRARHGDEMVGYLRTHRFPFGGILRQPPRILRAPILFAEDGVRFRLGGIMDAFQVLQQTPTQEEESALIALIEAVRQVRPYQFSVGSGDGVIMLNRQTLHSRTVFRDPQRLLLRIRGYNPDLSVTDRDSSAGWSEEQLV